MTVSNFKLYSILCCLFLTAVSTPSIIAEAPEPRGAKKAPSTICHFTLGAILETSDRENRDQFLKECALDLKEVVKALNDCKVTVVKKQVARADGRPGKDEALDLIIEGKQRFRFKDADKKDISLSVKKIELGGTTIDLTKKPIRYVFDIGFEIRGKHTIKLLGVLEAEHTFTWGFTSPCYGYDAEGKTFDPKKISSD
jgi:hypothetical protein